MIGKIEFGERFFVRTDELKRGNKDDNKEGNLREQVFHQERRQSRAYLLIGTK